MFQLNCINIFVIFGINWCLILLFEFPLAKPLLCFIEYSKMPIEDQWKLEDTKLFYHIIIVPNTLLLRWYHFTWLIDLTHFIWFIYPTYLFLCLFTQKSLFQLFIYIFIYSFVYLFIKLIVYLLIYLLIICIERRKHNKSIAAEDKMTYFLNNGRDLCFNQEQKFKSLATIAKHFSKTTWNWKTILCLCITLDRKNEIFKYTNFGYSYNT